MSVDIKELEKKKQLNFTENKDEIVDEIDNFLGEGKAMSFASKQNFCNLLEYEDGNIQNEIGIKISEEMMKRVE